MATRTFAVERDARVGTDGSLNLGAGACDHLPVGEGGGYHYRSFIKFDNDWSGMTDVSQVRLYLTNTDEYHLSRGSASTDRKFYVDRVTEGWSAGTASHPMTTSNGSISSGGDMVYPGPTCSTSGSNRVGPFTSSNVDNDQDSWDVTDLFKLIGPSTVYFSGASIPGYGSGNDNYGIRLIREDSGDTMEFWSSEKGGASYVPKIVVTYTSNTLPVATLTDPAYSGTSYTGGTTYGTPSVTIGVSCTDADGDTITNIQIQIDDDTTFSTPLVDSTADDDVAGVVSRVISSASLLRGYGNQMYVRARCHDGTGWGSWSGTRSFYLNDAASPAITGTAATVMEMTVEGTDSGPRAVVRFTYSDPEGEAMSRYICKLQDSTGVTTYETIDTSTSTVPEYVKFSYASLVHGTTYKFSVETFDVNGLSAGATTQNRVAKWATRDEYYAVSAPSSWSISTVKAEATDTRAVLQHGVQTSGAAGTDPSNFNTDFSALSSSGATYYWVRYWLFAWNGAATSGVQVTSHTLTYTSSSLTAAGWTLGTGCSITTARSWYGTRCLRIDGVASNPGRSASISVTGFKVGQVYTISGRVFSSGNTNATWSVTDANGTVCDAGVIHATTEDFEFTYNSFTAASETYTIICYMSGDAGTFAMFDAGKIEEGPIATPWTPSVLSRAISVDGNGIQVDARGGGMFRVRGSDTTTSEAEVDTIDRGLRFSSPLTLKEISSPSNPAANHRRLFLKSDGLLYLRNSAGTEIALGGGESLAATLAIGADANNVAISNLDLAAGSASAGTWPTLASGTLLTTAEAGAIERDSDVFYMTTDAGNRGVVAVEHIIRADSTRTFTSNTSDQVIFTSPTNGRLTLETGTYLIEGMLAFTSMSATSGNLVFKLKGGGSATLAAIMVHTFGQDLAASGTAAAVGGQWNTSGDSTTNSVTAAGATSLLLRVYGTFEVSAGGTIQPTIAMTTASASVLSIGSHLRVRRIGSQSLVSVGQWD